MKEERVRLSKILSNRGICSRREADVYIDKGLVKVDGHIVSTLGTKVAIDAQIELLPRAKKQQEKKITLLLNKPVGYVSTQPEKGYRPASDLLPRELQKKVHVAGRLDIDSKGLLVFTQDGTIAKALIGPNTSMEKEYLVWVNGDITSQKLERLRFGLALDQKLLKRAHVELMSPQLIKMILTEGKKRQIRRMCDLVGLKVKSLKRVRVGAVVLGHLAEGKWRYLSSDEIF